MGGEDDTGKVISSSWTKAPLSLSWCANFCVSEDAEMKHLFSFSSTSGSSSAKEKLRRSSTKESSEEAPPWTSADQRWSRSDGALASTLSIAELCQEMDGFSETGKGVEDKADDRRCGESRRKV